MRPASAPPLRGASRAPAARAQPSMRSSTLTIVELASANPLLPQRELDRVLRGQRVMGRLLAATLQGDPGVLLTRDSKLTRLLAGCLGEVALMACMHGEGDEGAAAAAASGDDVTYRFLQQLQPGGLGYREDWQGYCVGSTQPICECMCCCAGKSVALQEERKVTQIQ